jgi:hypothetical protein
MPDRGSPGSQDQPPRAATRREALPVRHAPSFGRPVRPARGRAPRVPPPRAAPRAPACAALRPRWRPPAPRARSPQRGRTPPHGTTGGSATPATTCATCAVRRPASYSRATVAGSAYTHERSTNSRHRQPASESAGDPDQTSAMVSMPSVSASRSTRSATAGSSAARAPRTSRLAARSAASLTRAGSSPPMISAKNSAPGFIGRWCWRSDTLRTLRASRKVPGAIIRVTGGGQVESAFRIRCSLTGYAVPSCCAHSETRSSSSIQRTCRSLSPGGRPSGSAATWWR